MSKFVDDVEIIREQKEGYSAETINLGQGDEKVQVSLVLDMQDTPELPKDYMRYHNKSPSSERN